MAYPFDIKMWRGATGWEFPARPPRGHHSNPREGNLFKGEDGDFIDALVRESLQNIIDARSGTGPALARFRIVRRSKEVMASVFGDAAEHWNASGVPMSRLLEEDGVLLVIEDYNTTGLTGDVTSNEADQGGFPAMVRWSGNSNKSGKGSGRFGLGKISLMASSRARSFFLFTNREGDSQPHFIGKAMLEAHEARGLKREPWGFFYGALHNGVGPELPFSGKSALCLAEMLGCERTNETGTSVIIPWPQMGVTEESLLRTTLTHFFHQIARGKVVVEIGAARVDANTVGPLAARLFPSDHAVNLRLRATRLMDDASAPRFSVDAATKSSLELRPSDVLDLTGLKAAWAVGEPFVVEARFPIETPFEVEMGEAEPDMVFAILPVVEDAASEIRKPLFVRKGCTIPAQLWGMQRGLVVAEVVSERAIWFFNQCENPAHDRWIRGDAPNPGIFMQAVLLARRLEELCAPPKDEAAVTSCFTDFFAVLMRPDQRPSGEEQSQPRRADGAGESQPGEPDESKPGDIESRDAGEPFPVFERNGSPDPATRLTFAYLNGNFSVRGRVVEADAGTELTIEVGYKINKRKSGIKKHSTLDFDLTDTAAHEVFLEGAELVGRGENTITIHLTGGPLSVRIGGFDQNRALDYSARSNQNMEGGSDAE